MCGIYATNIPVSEEYVAKRLTEINYRGPDNLGVKKYGAVTFGHLRLSILDLDERSNQPLEYKDLTITFNGEIYNYLDLKSDLEDLGYEFRTTSDTEVLLIGYAHWGTDMLSRINGMFAFCIYDRQSDSIIMVRDRMGVKPLYYTWSEGQFSCCSQLRPLIGPESRPNEEAIGIYLDCGYIPSPFSAILGIHKLKPGHYIKLNLREQQIQEQTYWDLQPRKVRKDSYETCKAELHDLLRDAVRIRLQSDVPLGSFLSGGIDSALVTAIAQEVAEASVNSFTIGFDEAGYDESKVAEEYAGILQTNHQTIMCAPEDIRNLIPRHRSVYDEPFADSSALPSLLLNRVTKEHVTVALSGDGGDESFMGYNYLQFLKKNQYLFDLPVWLRKLLVRTGLLRLVKTVTGKSFPEALFLLENRDAYVEYFFTGSMGLRKTEDKNWLSHYRKYLNLSRNFLQRAADFNIKLWLENDSNVKVDRASMAYSVEVRSPFLDYRVVEFARNLPMKFRYRGTLRKRILRDILKEYIPEKVFDQPKRGFGVPLDEWIRGDLKDEFVSKLDDDFLNSVPYLDVAKFKEVFERHLSGKGNFKPTIWKLYVLRQWYEEFGFYKPD